MNNFLYLIFNFSFFILKFKGILRSFILSLLSLNNIHSRCILLNEECLSTYSQLIKLSSKSISLFLYRSDSTLMLIYRLLEFLNLLSQFIKFTTSSKQVGIILKGKQSEILEKLKALKKSNVKHTVSPKFPVEY